MMSSRRLCIIDYLKTGKQITTDKKNKQTFSNALIHEHNNIYKKVDKFPTPRSLYNTSIFKVY